MAYVALPTKNPGDVLTSALWNTYLQGNFDSGVMRKIADTTLLAPAASIDFTSIPATFAHLRLVVEGRDTNAATIINALLRINNDSAANYDHQVLQVSGATVVGAETFGATSIPFAIAGASALAGLFATATFDICDYAGAIANKVVKATNAAKHNTAAGNMNEYLRSGFWRSSAAVNRITLLAGGTNFDIGTRATLYGLPA